MRNLIKKVTHAIQSASEDSFSLLKFAQKKVSQKAQKGVIKKNKAARVVSKLYRLFNQQSASPVVETETPIKVTKAKASPAKKSSAPKKAAPKKATAPKSATKKGTPAKKAPAKKASSKSKA